MKKIISIFIIATILITIILSIHVINVLQDTDLDGYKNNLDRFPKNPNEWADIDKDGYGDNTDDFPQNPNLHKKCCLSSIHNFTLFSGKKHYPLNCTCFQVDCQCRLHPKIFF